MHIIFLLKKICTSYLLQFKIIFIEKPAIRYAPAILQAVTMVTALTGSNDAAWNG